jgi:hypothetical protein
MCLKSYIFHTCWICTLLLHLNNIQLQTGLCFIHCGRQGTFVTSMDLIGITCIHGRQYLIICHCGSRKACSFPVTDGRTSCHVGENTGVFTYLICSRSYTLCYHSLVTVITVVFQNLWHNSVLFHTDWILIFLNPATLPCLALN